jgi:hypothetical protein
MWTQSVIHEIGFQNNIGSSTATRIDIALRYFLRVAHTPAGIRRATAAMGHPRTTSGIRMKLTIPGMPQSKITLKAAAKIAIAGHNSQRSCLSVDG